MTPTPPLPSKDADVVAVREALEHVRYSNVQPSLRKAWDANDARAALDRLATRLQETERERDGLRAWKTATHEQWAAWTRDDFKARAEAAEVREASLREALERLLYNAELIFSKKPVRDWGETLAEARDVLATADPRASK